MAGQAGESGRPTARGMLGRGRGAVHTAGAGLTALGLLFGAGSAAIAQETPTVVPPTAPAAADTQPAAVFTVGAPHLQPIAQGVVALEGPVVWRVREVTLSSSATQETAPASFLLQRTGASIVRNDVSERRVRLEPGEAAFTPAGHPFSPPAIGADPSIAWIVELLPEAEAAAGSGSTLFTTEPVADYPAGTFDIELQRTVLLPGEVSELPARTGPALVMIAAGRVQISAVGEPPVPLGAGNGVLAPEALTVRNGDTEPASFVVATIGESVDAAGETAGVPQAAPTAASVAPPTQAPLLQTPVAPTAAANLVPTVVPPVVLDPTPVPAAVEPTPVPAPVEPTPVPEQPAVAISESGDTDGDGLSDVDEAAYGSDPLNKDYDADGLLDGEEVYVFGSDPLNNDTDGDGLLDGEESSSYGTSPATSDADGDGLTDTDEIFTNGTDPAAFDTDGDGVGDGEEVSIYGTNPLDPASGP